MRSLCALLVFLSVGWAAKPYSEAKALEAYEKAVRAARTDFLWDKKLETPPVLSMQRDPRFYQDALEVQGIIKLVLDPQNDRVLEYLHRPLDLMLKREDTRASPHFSLRQVRQRAAAYLQAMGIEVPEFYRFSSARFHEAWNDCWEVRWSPFYQNIPYDIEQENQAHALTVVFHEKHGLRYVRAAVIPSQPKSAEVLFSSEEAIIKASEAVPRIMDTSYYAKAREKGFLISRLRTCELNVCTPNWILDESKAVLTRQTAPDEWRVCWKVTFDTTDVIDRRDSEGRRVRQMSPVFMVMIDAKTGECVGGRFL